MPIRNQAHTYRVDLIDPLTNTWRTNPTIAVGDFRVSVDGGALANLATTPTVEPAGSSQVRIALSAGEMNGEIVRVYGRDPDGQWEDVVIEFVTTPYAPGARVIEGALTEDEVTRLTLAGVMSAATGLVPAGGSFQLLAVNGATVRFAGDIDVDTGVRTITTVNGAP